MSLSPLRRRTAVAVFASALIATLLSTGSAAEAATAPAKIATPTRVSTHQGSAAVVRPSAKPIGSRVLTRVALSVYKSGPSKRIAYTTTGARLVRGRYTTVTDVTYRNVSYRNVTTYRHVLRPMALVRGVTCTVVSVNAEELSAASTCVSATYPGQVVHDMTYDQEHQSVGVHYVTDELFQAQDVATRIVTRTRVLGPSVSWHGPRTTLAVVS